MTRARTFLGVFVAVVVIATGAIAQSPSDLNTSGIEAYQRGDYDTAVDLFERAMRAAPSEDVVRHNLCNALQGQANNFAKAGDFGEATRILDDAIKVDPDNFAPLVQQGSYLLRLDRVPEAIRRLEEAIEIKPGELDAHEMLGRAYYEDNDIPSARAQWDYVLTMDPKRETLRELYEKAFREEAVEWDFNRKSSRHFNLSYPPGTPYPLRQRVLTILEGAYREVGSQLGRVYPEGPIQVIIYTAEDFSEATQLEAHVGAVYDGKIRVPVTDRQGNTIPDDELVRRLTHEYVHVVVRHVAGDKVPWWLNEGLAETLSKGLTPQDQTMLQRLYANNAAFELGELEAHQLKRLDPESLRMAYVQSHATVAHMVSRYGTRIIPGLLEGLGTGQTMDEVIRMNTRRTYGALEQEVAQEHRK
jgi:hypothetical protein